MPEEVYEADCGWKAGPKIRALPVFKGRTPGPTNPNITAKSTRREIMNTQLTLPFRQYFIAYTKAHADQWRKDHDDWRNDCIEYGMCNYSTKLKVDHFELSGSPSSSASPSSNKRSRPSGSGKRKGLSSMRRSLPP